LTGPCAAFDVNPRDFKVGQLTKMRVTEEATGLRRYGLALAICLAAAGVGWLSGAPAACFLLAITVTSLHVGKGPGLLSVGFCSVAYGLFLLSPQSRLITEAASYGQFLAFIAASLVISLAIQRIQNSDAARRHIIESIPKSVWWADADGALEFLSSRALKYTGTSLEDMMSSGWTNVLHPDDVGRTKDAWSRSVRSGETFDAVYRLRRFDGAYRWFHTAALPLRDRKGKIVRWYGVDTDIDDLKQTEEALKTSERSLRILVDSIPGMIAGANPKGQHNYANRRLLDYVGVTLADAADRGWINVVHPDERDFVMSEWLRSAKTGEPYDVVHRMRRADGEYRWFHVRAEPLRDERGHIDRWYALLVDVDDRKRAEEALLKSEQQFRLLIDTIPALVWSTMPDGRRSYMNNRTLTYLGMDREHLPEYQFSCVHPDDAEPLAREWAYALESGEPFSSLHRLRHADGGYRWHEARAEALRDETGNVVQWYGVNVDVDDRQKAEEALRQSEQQLRQLIDTIPSLVWCATPEGEPSYLNKRLMDYLGVGLDQFDTSDGLSLQAAAMSALVHPDDLPGSEKLWAHCIRTGESYIMRYRLRRADGAYRWMDGRREPLRDEEGRVVQWYCVTIDIDDRQKAEEALRRSEHQLRLLTDTIPALVWCATPDGKPSYVNKRLIDYTGMSLDGFDNGGNSAISLRAVVHPNDLPAVERLWFQCVATGESFAMRYRLRRADGVYRLVDGRADPLRDEAGRVVQWYGVNVDIEDETQMQDALRSAQDKLSRAAQAASLSEMSASIAHEINQPLAAIVTSGYACLRWLSADPPNVEKARLTAERTIRDGNVAADVVRRIRALFQRSTVAAGSRLDINSVIAEVCQLLSDEACRRNVRIETGMEPELPPAAADRVQIQQLLMNLARNALDAMDQTDDSFKELFIRSRRNNKDTLLIEVRDYGAGLTDVDKVFEPFFTTKAKGMGMGLAICRSIVEAHAGRLWASKNECRGATFSFTLPVQKGNA
jgi:hypothetical protein